MAPAAKYRVGVIGYGLSAKIFQIPYIEAAAAFELAAIVQRSGDTAKQDHPGCTIYRSPEALFEDPNIDVVVVSTPPTCHYDHVSGALDAGKNVIVEKPFCPTSKECDDLINLAERKSKLLAVFQNRRWDADFITLQNILSEDRLGRVVEFESHFDRFDPAAAGDKEPPSTPETPGSGVIFDLGTHLIDQVLVQFGHPSKVTCTLSHQYLRAPAAPDACTIWLHYDAGLMATIKASAVSADAEKLRFWVRGTEGSFKKYHLDPQEPQLAGGMKTNDPQFGHEAAEKSGTLTLWEHDKLVAIPHPNLPPPTYRAFYDLFAEALDGKKQLPVTAREARNVIRIVEAAKQSSTTGTTVVLKAEDYA